MKKISYFSKFLKLSFLAFLTAISMLNPSLSKAELVDSVSNFSGQWNGTGNWNYQGQGEGDLCQMHLNFIQSDTHLERKAGYFDCTMVGLEVLAEQWDIDGSKLINKGIEVGHIYQNKIKIVEKLSKDLTVNTEMEITGKKIDYVETWYLHNALLYQIKGKLFKH